MFGGKGQRDRDCLVLGKSAARPRPFYAGDCLRQGALELT